MSDPCNINYFEGLSTTRSFENNRAHCERVKRHMLTMQYIISHSKWPAKDRISSSNRKWHPYK